MHWAAAAGHYVAVERLSSDKSIVAKDDMGLTPLHWAALNGRSQIVEYLIHQRATIDAPAQGRCLRDFEGELV